MTCYLTRYRLRNPGAMHRLQDMNGVHAEAWRLADKPRDTPRDFLFRYDERPVPTLVLQSATAPLTTHPDWMVDVQGVVSLAFAPGQTLHIVGRVAPSVDVSRGARARRVLQLGEDPVRQAAALFPWLARRFADRGLQLEEGSLRVPRTFFAPYRGRGWVMADLTCRAVVIDPARASGLFAVGIGDARAFGGGLFLAR